MSVVHVTVLKHDSTSKLSIEMAALTAAVPCRAVPSGFRAPKYYGTVPGTGGSFIRGVLEQKKNT